MGAEATRSLSPIARSPATVSYTHLDVYKRQSYNWSLKHVSPTFIAVVTLGEPVGSAGLAWLFFAESFAWLQGIGFVLLLVGIYLAARGEGQ